MQRQAQPVAAERVGQDDARARLRGSRAGSGARRPGGPGSTSPAGRRTGGRPRRASCPSRRRPGSGRPRRAPPGSGRWPHHRRWRAVSRDPGTAPDRPRSACLRRPGPGQPGAVDPRGRCVGGRPSRHDSGHADSLDRPTPGDGPPRRDRRVPRGWGCPGSEPGRDGSAGHRRERGRGGCRRRRGPARGAQHALRGRLDRQDVHRRGHPPAGRRRAARPGRSGRPAPAVVQGPAHRRPDHHPSPAQPHRRHHRRGGRHPGVHRAGLAPAGPATGLGAGAAVPLLERGLQDARAGHRGAGGRVVPVGHRAPGDAPGRDEGQLARHHGCDPAADGHRLRAGVPGACLVAGRPDRAGDLADDRRPPTDPSPRPGRTWPGSCAT